jgi:hypothetical protein
MIDGFAYDGSVSQINKKVISGGGRAMNITIEYCKN